VTKEPGKAVRVLKGIGLVVGGILVSPIFLFIAVIPKKLYKTVFLLIALGLGYRYIYPKESVVIGLHRVADAFAYGINMMVRAGMPLWRWLDNETNATFLASIVALFTLIGTVIARRSDLKRERRQQIAKATPRMTVGFAPTGDGKFACTLLNIGGGTALAVKFSFHVLDNPGNHSYSEDVWRIRNSESYHYILPEAKDPKSILLDPIDTSRSPELMVKCEYMDSLDRNHYAFAYGGQSSDGTFMSVGTWHTRTTTKGQSVSMWARAGAYFFLQSERGLARIGNAMRRFLPSDEERNKDWRRGMQKVVETQSEVSSGGPDKPKQV
jgi:hypothetical protein